MKDSAVRVALVVVCLGAWAAGCDNNPSGVPIGVPDTTSDLGTLSDAKSEDSVYSDAATPAEWFACQTSADCATVELGCCDHCNGGKGTAAAKEHVAEVKAALGETPCNRVACTAMGCAPLSAVCNAGKCELGSTACMGKAEAACKATPKCQATYGRPKEAYCTGKDPPLEYLGCNEGWGCKAIEGCATSPSGAKFHVNELCGPDGWTVESPSCCNVGCNAVPSTRLCVRGKPVSGGEQLDVGDVREVTVYPKGCFSSSCTKAVTSACVLGAGSDGLAVSAMFCLANTGTSGGGCTADCGGGGYAKCQNGVWAAGTQTVNLGTSVVTVTVPSLLPFGGACAGTQF